MYQLREVCLCGVITDADAPEVVPTPHKLKKIDTDVVIVGGGAAGLIAAVRVQELTGKKVVVLEKAKKCGGNTWFAHALEIHGSRWQLEAGDDDRDAKVNWVLSRFHNHFSQKLVRDVVYTTGRFFDWMYDLDPVEGSECFELADGQNFWFSDLQLHKIVRFPTRKYYNLKCPDIAEGPGYQGSYIIRKMLQECEKRGIQILTETAAVRIMRDEAGAFSGILAKDPGGEVEVRGKACVLALGNCMHNEELIRKHWPGYYGGRDDEPMHIFSVPTNTGDIVDLCHSADLEVDYSRFWANIFGPIHHPWGFMPTIMGNSPDACIVNLDGKRFFNEGGFFGGSDYICQQPHRVAWSIFDDDAVEEYAERFKTDRKARWLESSPEMDWAFSDLRKTLDYEISLGKPAKKADTLEELALQCGINVKNFLETIERYNSFCEKGHDDDFLKQTGLRPIKKGPFYALFGKTCTESAGIGAFSNDDYQVLDKENLPVRGLYVAGDCSNAYRMKSDRIGETRDQIIVDMTWASVSGFRAAENIAEEFKADRL